MEQTEFAVKNALACAERAQKAADGRWRDEEPECLVTDGDHQASPKEPKPRIRTEVAKQAAVSERRVQAVAAEIRKESPEAYQRIIEGKSTIRDEKAAINKARRELVAAQPGRASKCSASDECAWNCGLPQALSSGIRVSEPGFRYGRSVGEQTFAGPVSNVHRKARQPLLDRLLGGAERRRRDGVSAASAEQYVFTLTLVADKKWRRGGPAAISVRRTLAGESRSAMAGGNSGEFTGCHIISWQARVGKNEQF